MSSGLSSSLPIIIPFIRLILSPNVLMRGMQRCIRQPNILTCRDADKQTSSQAPTMQACLNTSTDHHHFRLCPSMCEASVTTQSGSALCSCTVGFSLKRKKKSSSLRGACHHRKQASCSHKTNLITLVEGSHTPTSNTDTKPSRIGGTGVLQCQISLPITASNASI